MEATLHQIQIKKDQLEKTKQQQAALDKAHDKSSKLGLSMTVVGAVLSAIMVVATIMSFGAAAPIATAVIIGFTTLSAIDNAGIPAANGLMDGIGEMFVAMGMNSQAARAMSGVLLCVLAAATMNVAAFSQAFTATGVAQNILLAAGVDEHTAGIVNAVLAGVAMVASMSFASSGSKADVLTKIATKTQELTAKNVELAERIAVASARGGLAAMASKAVDSAKIGYNQVYIKMLNFARKAQRTEDFLETTINKFSTGLDASNSGMGVAQGVLESSISKMNGAMQKSQAEADADSVVWDNAIQSLKQQIQQLLQLLQSLTSWNASLGNMQQQRWTNNQEILSNLTSK
jgi:invasin B